MCYDAAYLRFFVDDKVEPTPLQRMENIDSCCVHRVHRIRISRITMLYGVV